jgi:hypothetical protein
MATSSEYLTQVSNLYVALFNRAPDTGGMTFWSEALANGASLSQIADGFLTAPEGEAIYAPTQTDTEFVTTFYQTVFGRAPDASGLAFWVEALNNAGGVDTPEARTFLVNAIVALVSSPAGPKPADMSDADYALTVNDRALFTNKVAYGVFVGTYDESVVTPGAQTSLAAITADPASVTAAQEAFGQAPGGGGGGGGGTDPDATPIVGTADDDTLTVADAASFTKTGFSVDGLDGSDTLIVQKANGALDPTGKIANIESVLITATGATTVDATKFAGVTAFGTLDSTASVAFSSLAEGQTGVVKGTNVDTSFGYDDAATTAAVAFDDAAGGAVKVTGAALTSLTVTATGAEAGTGTAVDSLDVTGSTINALTVDAATTFVAGSVTGLTDATLTVTGAGVVSLGTVSGVTAVDASASTGGVGITDLVDATSYVGSGAADLLGVSGTLKAGATIDLGAGGDVLTFAADTKLDVTGATVTLGEGADTVDVSALTLAEESDEAFGASVITIADFGEGDTITFSTVQSDATGVLQFFDQSESDAVYTAASAAIVSAGAAETPASIVGFLYGGDTYIVADVANDGGYSVGDVLVKLTGGVDLSTVSLFGNSVNYAAAEVPEVPATPELV